MMFLLFVMLCFRGIINAVITPQLMQSVYFVNLIVHKLIILLHRVFCYWWSWFEFSTSVSLSIDLSVCLFITLSHTHTNKLHFECVLLVYKSRIWVLRSWMAPLESVEKAFKMRIDTSKARFSPITLVIMEKSSCRTQKCVVSVSAFIGQANLSFW